MKISFDLDDTIISNNRFPLEKETFGLKLSDAKGFDPEQLPCLKH
jgi:hypothetical protein